MGRKDLSHFWMDATVNASRAFSQGIEAYEDEEWRVSGTQNGEKRFASSWKLDLGD